jgi:hypothetical protein
MSIDVRVELFTAVEVRDPIQGPGTAAGVLSDAFVFFNLRGRPMHCRRKRFGAKVKSKSAFAGHQIQD